MKKQITAWRDSLSLRNFPVLQQISFRFCLFHLYFNHFFLYSNRNPKVSLVYQARSDVMNIFGLIWFPGQRQQSLVQIILSEICFPSSVIQEETYNIAAGFFRWGIESWFHTESQHSDDCLTCLLWAYYKMLVFEVSECLYWQKKHEGTGTRPR